ncbi:hypothetical protein DTO96_100558 [Ephemeroptericola cinctiostellae]|uniref:Prophage CP4-57 regulatory protein (AlpA) n=1 Tax=Ephemeroptericola cinctiostellae TaxID=2268024 RepID=A0A345D910_9BURK|nr:AlpA family transcriptional regulator [Ephemeroptericola cinctiostellae]AXF84848.1 hypothetical protein DTO96_100558 [Ephemeroptericola cinctiostellae]
MNQITTESTTAPHTQSFKERLLNLKEVKHRTGLGKSTIYNMITNGTFPKQRAITERRVCWLESEIDKWIASKISKLNY